jgi:hypothetical protein
MKDEFRSLHCLCQGGQVQRVSAYKPEVGRLERGGYELLLPRGEIVIPYNRMTVYEQTVYQITAYEAGTASHEIFHSRSILGDFNESVLKRGFNPCQWITKHIYLLAFLEGPRIIVHRYFQGGIAFADQFNDQFKVKIEAVALKFQVVDTVPPENLKHRKRILHLLAI